MVDDWDSQEVIPQVVDSLVVVVVDYNSVDCWPAIVGFISPPNLWEHQVNGSMHGWEKLELLHHLPQLILHQQQLLSQPMILDDHS